MIGKVKRIGNYKNHFISNTGRVYHRRNKTCKLKVRKPWSSNRGYYVVTIMENKIKKKHTISRLVAEAFIPNPNNYPIVLHIDNNRLNNWVNNLKWGTQKQNVDQTILDGRVSKSFKLPQTKLSIENCKEIIKAKGKPSIVLAKRFGVSRRLISFVMMGKTFNSREAIKQFKK